MFSLRTPRLLIRQLSLDDIDAVFAYRSDPDITRYQMWRPREPADIRNFIRDQAGLIPGIPGAWFQMGIVVQKNAQVVGDCGILVAMDDPTSAELGLTLRGDAQHRGYASETLSALLEYCFSTLDMRRVVARVFSGNVPALTLVERGGFRFSGRISSKLDDETEGSDLLYILERRDWTGDSNAR